MKRIKNNNSLDFIFYTSTIILLFIILILKISMKNEFIKTQGEIELLNNTYINNSSIVKELQSSRDYLMSHDYISNYLSDKMVVAVPETLIINIDQNR
tara:strand:- start:1001 stop:1294 length:294 start_codon:yes stop_codon:yes gene_type:complete